MILKTKKNFYNGNIVTWDIKSSKVEKYSVIICDKLFDTSNNLLAENQNLKIKSRRLIFIDNNFSTHFYKKVDNYFFNKKFDYKIVPLDIKEEDKNLESLNKILKFIDNFGIERRSEPIIVIGGGVLTDIVGFAASIYRRGIPYIKIATTLLCAIDSCVGVKTSINHFSRRNRLGTYFGPEKSYVDLSLLQTLPEEEIAASIGEIIKIATIKNKNLFNKVFLSSKNLLKPSFYKSKIGKEIIELSIHSMLEELHNNLEEKNLKRSVDFGHTFSPVIEMRSLDDQSVQSLKHGEAVCLDVLLSSCISFQKGYLKKNELVKIFSLAKSVKMPLNHSFITNVDYLLESLLDATKHRNGSQNFPIPTKIGSYKFLNDIKIEDIRKAIKIYQGNTND